MPLPEVPARGTATTAQVMNYLYQLDEQLRYVLSHIEGDNIVANSIGANQLKNASVSADKIDSRAVTGDKLAPESVAKDNLSPEVLESIQATIKEGMQTELSSADFARRVGEIIKDSPIDWRKICEPDSDALFQAGTGIGILFPRLRLNRANLAPFPEGQFLLMNAGGALVALTQSGTQAASLSGGALEDAAISESKIAPAAVTEEKLSDGAVTLPKISKDALQSLAAEIDADAFFARPEVIAAVRAIIDSPEV